MVEIVHEGSRSIKSLVYIPGNLDFSRAEARLQECVEFLGKLEGDIKERMVDSFQKSIDTISRLAGTKGGQVYLDFAPLSFMWQAGGMTGGMIFHGKHDGFGSGQGPTFSVCLEAHSGWSIHT